MTLQSCWNAFTTHTKKCLTRSKVCWMPQIPGHTENYLSSAPIGAIKSGPLVWLLTFTYQLDWPPDAQIKHYFLNVSLRMFSHEINLWTSGFHRLSLPKWMIIIQFCLKLLNRAKLVAKIIHLFCAIGSASGKQWVIRGKCQYVLYHFKYVLCE